MSEASPASSLVCVLDVGKTNLKALVATPDGWPVETLSTPNTATMMEGYLAYDLARLEAWFLDALGDLAIRHPIRAVVATAHGCGAVLVDDEGPVLPMMDYEAPCPAWLDALYDEHTPPFEEVFCATGPGVKRLAKQLMWQERAYPAAFEQATAYLTTAQYLAWRLGGRAASEISQLAAQGHLWATRKNDFSSLVLARGWDGLFPPRARAGDVLGIVSADVVARTGLRADTQVLCGVHDSNADLFRYKAGGKADATILSTGTWMIGFNRHTPLERLDPKKGMTANVDVDGEPVSSTLTMTGREFALIRGVATVSDGEVMAAMPRLLEKGTMAMPSFVEDDGAFPGSARRGAVRGPAPADDAERQALATLYAAFTAQYCLDALASAQDIIIDGGFASNHPFGQVLAALRPQQHVAMSQSPDGTALGAALLWRRFVRTAPVDSITLDSVAYIPIQGVQDAYRQWIALWETAA